MEISALTVHGDYILLKVNRPETTTEGGIQLPDSAVRPNNEGVILKFGAGVTAQLTEGDTAIFNRSYPFCLDPKQPDHVVIAEEDLIATYKPT